MRTNMLRTTTMAAVLFGLAGAAQADGPYFRSSQSGNYSSAGTWEQTSDPNGIWSPANVPPGASDYVEVSSGHTVTINGTDESALDLTIDATGLLSLINATPSVTVVGILSVYGEVRLNSSIGAPFMVLQSNSATYSGGEIKGLATAAAQPEIYIDANAGANTLTNEGTLSGDVIMRGANTGSYNAVFDNQGVVTADAAAELKLDSTLSSISDNSSALWKVETSGSAVLTFGRGSTSLAGAFSMLVSGGTMNVNSSITTSGPFAYNYGTVIIPTSRAFGFGSLPGSCGTQPPNNPLTHADSPFAGCP